jgi:hypothetical protein
MISYETASIYAKAIYGSSVKLTPQVYKFEGTIEGFSNVELIKNLHGKFLMTKIVSTVTAYVSVRIRTPKQIASDVTSQDLSEINDCDEVLLPVRSLGVYNGVSTPRIISVFVYGYDVE